MAPVGVPRLLWVQHAHHAVEVGGNYVKQAVEAGVFRGRVWCYTHHASPDFCSVCLRQVPITTAGWLHARSMLSSQGSVSGAHAS